MQAQLPLDRRSSAWRQRLGWLSLGPLSALLLLLLILLLTLVRYEERHDGRIYTGVYTGRVDLGELTPDEAAARLAREFTRLDEVAFTLVDPRTGQEWVLPAGELGLSLDVPATVAAAYDTGRSGPIGAQLGQMFNAWYYGLPISPVLILDEAVLFARIDRVAGEIGQPPADAAIQIDGEDVTFVSSQVGRALDRPDLYERLMGPLAALEPARIELLVHESRPRVFDASEAAAEVAHILSGPLEFYLSSPLDDIDLGRLTLGVDRLREWLRVRLVDDGSGQSRYEIFIDEVGLQGWLGEYAARIQRDPENARFYFDDPTGELVLVEPHVSGRELDIAATIARIQAQIKTPNRSVPLVIREIVPVVNSNATAAELGITELIGERTTWFFGSSNNRKHNIARSAANFYGIVVAPGEQFSFNKYLGEISEEEGYETGLIILGGQTIEGVGGGVCQVSTTLFQSVFWAGLDINARLEHGYQVSYYNDGEGPGMDATVYQGLVDFTFTNNTPHYLLIENYYNAQFESLTFKIYSTNIGRRVEKSGPVFENVQEPPPDEWIFNPELASGFIRQTEFAAEGARVIVERTVYNFEGDVRDQDILVSNYIPWGNVYEYGPDVDPTNISRRVYDILWNEGEVNLFELNN